MRLQVHGDLGGGSVGVGSHSSWHGSPAHCCGLRFPRLGPNRPPGLWSLLGPKAAKAGPVLRLHAGTCAIPEAQSLSELRRSCLLSTLQAPAERRDVFILRNVLGLSFEICAAVCGTRAGSMAVTAGCGRRDLKRVHGPRQRLPLRRPSPQRSTKAPLYHRLAGANLPPSPFYRD